MTEEEEEQEEEKGREEKGGGLLNKGLIEGRRGENGGMTFRTMSVTAVMCESVKCRVSY